MENIMDLSSVAFRGDTVERLSSRLHESRGATKRGIEGALPLSIAGLAEHASTEGNAASLLSTLKGGNYPHVEARDLSRVVADPAATDRVVQSGSGFLSRIFGNKVGALIDALAVQSGLSRSSATTMLGLATPLVLDTVGKEAKARNLDAAGLSHFLADQERRVSDRLPSNFARSVGGAATVGGLMAGPFVVRQRAEAIHERAPVIHERAPVIHEEPRAKSGLGWLLVGLAVLGAIALLALAFRRTEAPTAVPDLETRPPEVTAPEAPQVVTPEIEVTPRQAAAPEVAAPEAATPPAAAPQVAQPEASPRAAPEAEAPTAASPAEVATVSRGSGPPAYWILRDDANPLSAYLAGADRAPQRFLLAGIEFDVGSSEVSPNATLDEAAEALEASGAKIRIDGHADIQGSAADNERLSLARAEAVKSYLVSKGVPEGNITTRGLSERRPLSKNDTFEGRAENRRVELVVIER
jgi:outer membrane protein OmpA-like peptidoglycan-associated protein